MTASRRNQREVAKRRENVLAMRGAGASWQAIAEATGHKSAGAAAQDAARGLRAIQAELAEHADLHVVLEVQRLDHLERVTQNLLRAAANPDARTHDPLMALRAVDRLVRISQHRALLLHMAEGSIGTGADDAPVGDDEGDSVDQLAARRARRRAGG